MFSLQQELQVVISCRPARAGKSMDSAESISILGSIVSKMIEEGDNSRP